MKIEWFTETTSEGFKICGYRLIPENDIENQIIKMFEEAELRNTRELNKSLDGIFKEGGTPK